MSVKIPKWFKPELSLGSLIGGFVTVVAIPYFKWVTISLLTLQADVADIKHATVPDHSAMPLKRKIHVVQTRHIDETENQKSED